MISELNPGLILIIGALLIPIAPASLRGAISIALPVLAILHLASIPHGEYGNLSLFGLELVTLRVDRLSFVFGLIFLIAAVLAAVFALHVKGWLEATAAQMYAGSAVGAVFAGDLVTLFVFWEITAVTSVFLIWARRTQQSFDSGMRYLVIQIGSGVILLAGVLMHTHATGLIAFDQIGDVDWTGNLGAVSLATWLILIGVGIKAGFPLLNNWLADAYPQATVTGTVWLSSFTTKLAIYTLARGFPGSDILIPIGIVMIVVPLIYAAVEDDLRRILSYALNNQLGFMVVAIGIGSELALNGVAAHAVSHILYKSLLFMSIGAVLYSTGSARASELGGLARAMPLTAAFCIVGALAMSTPAFAGFISKALITSAAMKSYELYAWLALIFGSAGVFLVAGLRVPFAAFFAPGTRQPDAPPPTNMYVAMGATALACLIVGLAPSLVYERLPNAIAYNPYTLEHVLAQLQLLAFTALAFALMITRGWYPAPRSATLLDTDWLYRRLGYNLAGTLLVLGRDLWAFVARAAQTAANKAEQTISRTHNPESILGRTWSTGVMAFWATAMLAGYLVLFYFRYLPN